MKRDKSKARPGVGHDEKRTKPNAFPASDSARRAAGIAHAAALAHLSPGDDCTKKPGCNCDPCITCRNDHAAGWNAGRAAQRKYQRAKIKRSKR